MTPAMASSTADSFETSQIVADADGLISFSSFSAAAFLSGFVPQMLTSAPAAATARANPRPMPPLPPVTTATLPERSNASYAMESSAAATG